MRPASILLALLAIRLAALQLFETNPFNIKGEVLILDVASLDFNSSRSPSSTPSLTKQTCAEACARVRGCKLQPRTQKNVQALNAWTFCDNEAGCDSSCANYVEENPGFTACASGTVC